jgi:hypothetical protein
LTGYAAGVLLVALVVLACRLPSPDGSHPPTDTSTATDTDLDSDVDTDSDTDSDVDADTDSDVDTPTLKKWFDWGAYSGPPRLVITASNNFWKAEVGEWSLVDLESEEWIVDSETVDGNDLAPACSAAWVGVLRRGGKAGDGVQIHDALDGASLGGIDLDPGRWPRAAVGFTDGDVAIGFDTGTAIEIRRANGDLVRTIDLAVYADAAGVVHVTALAWWRGWLIAVLDAGQLTDALFLWIDPETGAASGQYLYSANISDEIAIVDDSLYLFGRGDSLHPAGIEWHELSHGPAHWLDAAALGVAAITSVSFDDKGFWMAAVDAKGASSARWTDYDGDDDPVIESDVPLGDIASAGRRGFWAMVEDGRTLRHYDYAGDDLGSWTFPATIAVRACGTDAL